MSKIKTHEDLCREYHSGFRGYRDNSPEAQHRRLETMMDRISWNHRDIINQAMADLIIFGQAKIRVVL